MCFDSVQFAEKCCSWGEPLVETAGAEDRQDAFHPKPANCEAGPSLRLGITSSLEPLIQGSLACGDLPPGSMKCNRGSLPFRGAQGQDDSPQKRSPGEWLRRNCNGAAPLGPGAIFMAGRGLRLRTTSSFDNFVKLEPLIFHDRSGGRQFVRAACSPDSGSGHWCI